MGGGGSRLRPRRRGRVCSGVTGQESVVRGLGVAGGALAALVDYRSEIDPLSATLVGHDLSLAPILARNSSVKAW
jgi:hypothetical protein